MMAVLSARCFSPSRILVVPALQFAIQDLLILDAWEAPHENPSIKLAAAPVLVKAVRSPLLSSTTSRLEEILYIELACLVG